MDYRGLGPGEAESKISDQPILRGLARKLLRRSRRIRGMVGLRLGQITKSSPLSTVSGFDRGKPIDRLYIERFLGDHSADIRGSVLEVGDDTYSRRFGGGRITRQDVLHVDHTNPRATIVGDLNAPGALPANSFDCIILTQTLQYIFDLGTALREIRAALRPGGVALMTVPAIAPVSTDWGDSYYWRFTANSVRRLLDDAFGRGNADVRPFGNLYAATTFLHGAALEEVNKKKLADVVPDYAIIIAARAVA